MTNVPFTDSDHGCQFCCLFFRTAADVIDHEETCRERPEAGS